MKKKYIKGRLTVSRLKMVRLRKPSRDSYNELSDQLLATYPGCGHSCTSDKRLKKNIRKIEATLPLLKRIKPVRFDWRGGTSPGDIGLLAQDLEKLYPEFVHTGKDGYKRIYYEKLTTVLISSVQELLSRIEVLESRNRE